MYVCECVCIYGCACVGVVLSRILLKTYMQKVMKEMYRGFD